MQVTGLHKWPYNPEDVTAEMERYEFSEFNREGMIELHQNAWILVLEHAGPASEMDFYMISYAASAQDLAKPMDRQVPWLEQVLTDMPDRSCVAFFIHYVNPDGRCFYGDEVLQLPGSSEMPAQIAACVKYECP